MSQANPTIPRQTATGATCGSCGAAVAVEAVTCPTCGVLLAAYQAPAGATVSAEAVWPATTGAAASTVSPVMSVPGDTSATHEVPSASMASPVVTTPAASPPPPTHLPRSRSPIGDALKRVQGIDPEASAVEESAAAAAELAAMAASDSTLAREVEAELAGAKVTFEGRSPVITADPASAAAPATPSVITSTSSTPALPVSPPQAAPQRIAAPMPARPARPATSRAPAPRPAAGLGGGFFFLVIMVLFFSIVLRFPVFGSIAGLILGIGVVAALVKLASLSGRKTTVMPWDDQWNGRRRRK